MLQATLRDANGQQIAVLGAPGQGLGFSIGGILSSIGDAIGSGANAAAGGVVDAANAVGSGVAQVGKTLPGIASGIASVACNIVNSSAVQTGASLVGKVPSGYTQGAAAGVAAGSAICNAANPPSTPQQPTQTSGRAAALIATMRPALSTTGKVAALPKPAAAAAFPAGTFQWKSSKTGMWVIAIPKAVAKAMGLGAYDMTLLGSNACGLGGFVSPWAPAAAFVSPHSMPAAKMLYQRQYNWYDTNTADRPYLATWGLNAAATVVGQQATQAAGVAVVTEAEGESMTKSILKKWWFWALVGGGTLALGGTATYFVRRRRHA